MATGKTGSFCPPVAAVAILVLLLAVAPIDQATCQTPESEQCYVACNQGYRSCRKGCLSLSKEDEEECRDDCDDSSVRCSDRCLDEPPPPPHMLEGSDGRTKS